jgi:hypothetical protein
MTGLTSAQRSYLPRRWQAERKGPPVGVVVAGVVVVGLGVLAWTYLGPDLRRYMKIHNM